VLLFLLVCIFLISENFLKFSGNSKIHFNHKINLKNIFPAFFFIGSKWYTKQPPKGNIFGAVYDVVKVEIFKIIFKFSKIIFNIF